ncbi:MAG: hypothetical protein RLY31_432 [Bacteroidota bacterium]|jgi:hypothetical protein
MNFKEIKLALTVALMNRAPEEEPLPFVESFMQRFRPEAGAFRGMLATRRESIGDALEKQLWTLAYDHCCLDLELIDNKVLRSQSLQRFEFRQN